MPASRQELKQGAEALGLLTAASPAFGSGSATCVIHYLTEDGLKFSPRGDLFSKMSSIFFEYILISYL